MKRTGLASSDVSRDASKITRKGLMMSIERANKSKPQDCGLRSLGEALDPPQNIIDFESGRKALKQDGFADEQNRVRLMHRSRVPSRLPEDWLEPLLTLVLFVGLLLGLVGEVITSWRS
jgi:hypothetical protein